MRTLRRTSAVVGTLFCLLTSPALADRITFNGCADSQVFAYYKSGSQTNLNFQVRGKAGNPTLIITFLEPISDPIVAMSGSATDQTIDLSLPVKYLDSLLAVIQRNHLLAVDLDIKQSGGTQTLDYMRFGDTGASGCR